MPLTARQMLDTLPSRVLMPHAMDAWLGFTSLPSWADAQRHEAQERLQQELNEWQASQREALEAELIDAIERRRDEAALEQAALAVALREQARSTALAMADAAAESVRQLLLDDDRAGAFQALVLTRLLPQLAALPAVAIHVPPQAARAATAALVQAFAAPQSALELVVDDRLQPNQCLVRSDDRLIEADLDTWIDELRTALRSLAGDAGQAAEVEGGYDGTEFDGRPQHDDADNADESFKEDIDGDDDDLFEADDGFGDDGGDDDDALTEDEPVADDEALAADTWSRR